MEGKKVVTAVSQMATPIIEKLGYEVVDVTYKKEFSGYVLTVFIDSELGITLSDCEKVSRALDKPLDELNPTNDVAYNFNVSSPGLDRPLKTERDFKKNLGKMILVKTYAPVSGKKSFEGVLKNYNDTTIEIDINGSVTSLNFKQISNILPVVII